MNVVIKWNWFIIERLVHRHIVVSCISLFLWCYRSQIAESENSFVESKKEKNIFLEIIHRSCDKHRRRAIMRRDESAAPSLGLSVPTTAGVNTSFSFFSKLSILFISMYSFRYSSMDIFSTTIFLVILNCSLSFKGIWVNIDVR